MAVTFLVAMRCYSQILTRASMTKKKTSVCGGVHLVVISATCSVCCEKHVRLSWSLPSAFHSFLSLFGSSQVSCCTLCVSIHVHRDEEGFSLTLSMLSFILLTCGQYRSIKEESSQFCGFLSGVFCILVTRKEQFTSTKW